MSRSRCCPVTPEDVRLILHQLLKNLICLIYIRVMYINFLRVVSDTFQNFLIDLPLFSRQLLIIIFLRVLFFRYGYFLIRNILFFI